MLTKEKIQSELASYLDKVKNDANFRNLIKDRLKAEAANQSFFRMLGISLQEMLSHVFMSENYDPGRKVYEDGDIYITQQDAKIILLLHPQDSALRRFVTEIIAFDNDWRTRIFAFLGAPTERRNLNDEQSFLSLGKNFIGYKDDGSVARNLFASLFYILLNLTVVSIKVFISAFKFVTEIFPFLFMTFFDKLADKIFANIKPEHPWYIKIPLYTAGVCAKSFAIINHFLYFIGRAVTSPAKGVTAASREGGRIGDFIAGTRASILGNIVASVFTSVSLFITVIGYLTLFPIKLTISFTTTIPFLARHLPAFIVKPIAYIVGKITPALVRFGDIVGKIFDPIVGPVAKALHENLNFMEVGLGGCAGLASAAAETSYTLFGSKLIKALAVGIVGLVVTAGNLISTILRKQEKAAEQRAAAPTTEPQSKMRRTTTLDCLATLGMTNTKNCKQSEVKQNQRSIPKTFSQPHLSCHSSALFSADSPNSTRPSYNHKQIIPRSVPIR